MVKEYVLSEEEFVKFMIIDYTMFMICAIGGTIIGLILSLLL